MVMEQKVFMNNRTFKSKSNNYKEELKEVYKNNFDVTINLLSLLKTKE